MEMKIHFRENWLIFYGIWGEAELILRIWGANENTFSTFRELRNFLSGIRGNQCIIFRDQGSTDPQGGGGSMARPSIEYSYIIWKPHHNRDIHSLEKQVQHRAD